MTGRDQQRTRRTLWTWGLLLGSLPAVAHAAGGGHHDFRWSVEGLYILDFAVLLAALIVLLRKPLGGFLARRREALSKDMREAAERRAAAQATLADYQARTASLDAEVARIRQDARADGDALKQQIEAEGRAQAAKLLRDADERAALEEEALLGRLEAELAERLLAVAAAQAATAARTPTTQRAFVADFVNALNQMAESPAGGTAGPSPGPHSRRGA